MEDNQVYLNKYQCYLYFYLIEELRQSITYFNDPIASRFEKIAMGQAVEIASKKFTTIGRITETLYPTKIVISRSLYQYLKNLTKIDVLNKKVLASYMPILEQKRKTAIFNVMMDAFVKNTKVKRIR